MSHSAKNDTGQGIVFGVIAGDAAWRKVALLRLPIAVALFGLAALA